VVEDLEGMFMKDEKGLFYYPFPQNKNTRMYVRRKNDTIEFRLWNADDPMLWKDHGWVPYDAVEQAKTMYQGKKFDPGQSYDLNLAQALINESNQTG
jgi:hypothetical protein